MYTFDEWVSDPSIGSPLEAVVSSGKKLGECNKETLYRELRRIADRRRRILDAVANTEPANA